MKIVTWVDVLQYSPQSVQRLKVGGNHNLHGAEKSQVLVVFCFFFCNFVVVGCCFCRSCLFLFRLSLSVVVISVASVISVVVLSIAWHVASVEVVCCCFCCRCLLSLSVVVVCCRCRCLLSLPVVVACCRCCCCFICFCCFCYFSRCSFNRVACCFSRRAKSAK